MVWAGEFEFIRSQLAPLSAQSQGAANLSDDGAILDLGPGERLAVTADTVIEGRHFPKGEDPELVARKALRVNLSDLAAMGAKPFAYTTSIAWPQDDDLEVRARGFIEGLRQDQDAFALGLVGGDTTRTNGPWTVSITAFGRIGTGFSLRRNRARAGDHLVVSGTIGDSGLGLAILLGEYQPDTQDAARWLLDRYRLPQPRLKTGMAARGLANAAIDVSDGLLSEAHHLAHESALSVDIDLDHMPVSPAARRWLDAQARNGDARLQLATHGDDYELLMAVPDAQLRTLHEAASHTGVPLTVLGQFRPRGERVLCVSAGGRSLEPERLGFTQF
jgi:thiamine-monophosphate kinase